jgi:predicted RNA-binding Zn-ribbon protein involved in translation (DUF1610 family)
MCQCDSCGREVTPDSNGLTAWCSECQKVVVIESVVFHERP